MRVSEIASVFDSYYGDLIVVRSFAWGQVVTGVKEGSYILILQEHKRPQHTLYEYDDPAEYIRDVQRVKKFPGSDNGEAGVGAAIPPPTPVLTAQGALRLPFHEKEGPQLYPADNDRVRSVPNA
jgi:hypothetical protein